MDEKTAELRDIFIDTTGSDTVTESQTESPGSLTEDGSGVDGRLAELIETMRERYSFDSGLDDEALRTVVKRFYEGDDDADIAEAVDTDQETVFDARMDLHLLRKADQESPFPLADLRALLVAETPVDERAEKLGTDAAVVAHFTAVVEAGLESTRANDRFRDEFEELLTDSELSTRMAWDAREDGLHDATEDIETNVSL